MLQARQRLRFGAEAGQLQGVGVVAVQDHLERDQRFSALSRAM